jgi:translocation and assembly module TamB
MALNLTRLQPGAWLAGGNAWAARLKDLSPLTLRLNLKGAGPPQAPRRLEGAFTCEPFAYRAARVEQFHLTLKGDHREQRLEGLLKGNFGRVEAAMTGPLLSGTGGAVKIQARELQPGLLGLAVESGSQVSGQFSGNFRLPASLSGNLEARGQWGRLPVKDLKARLSLHGRKLEVAQAQAQLGTLAVDFKGTVDPRGLDLQGKGSLALDGSWPALPTNLRGRLTGEAALKGPFAGPQFHLQAQGQDLAWGDFAWSRLTLKASGTAWPPASGRLEIQGTGLKTPAGVFSQVSLHSQGEGGRWQVRGAASSPEGLEAGMQGAAHLSARPFGITLERCRFRSPKVDLANTGPVTISFSPGLEMAPATFKVNDGRLLIRARTQGDGLTARLEAVDLPAGLFSLKGAELEGKIQGGLDLSGSLQHPSLQGQITWGPGKWGNFAFRSLQTGITYREESLVLRGGVEEKPEGPRLVWDGRIPLKLSFSPLGWAWGERDMDFRVQGERASLALLTALTPEVEKAEGSLSIMAQWQGNPGRPRVSGQLRWGEGTLQLRQAGRPFKLHGAAATLQGNKLVIPELALESGGMARVQGAITLAAFSPQHLDLRAQLQDFQALSRGGAEASASGLVTLSGPVSALVLKGRLLVSKASFRPSFFRTGIHPDIVLVKPPQAPGAKLNQKEELALWKNLQMDLVLDTDGGARIHDKRLKLELAGSLKVQKKPGGKAYTGGVLRTLKGTYELQGRPFKVERGEIRFPGKPGGEVTIEGRASHEFSGITMILIASGPANKPQVRMESVPPLPPQDLLAYLVFGRPAQTLTKEEYATVGQQALGILGGVTAKKIQEFLGADFPLVGNVSLKSGQEQGRQIVGIAKPITKDITVSFERKTSPLYRDDSTQVRLEYRYNKYLSVESQMGRRNTGADVLFNLDF